MKYLTNIDLAGNQLQNFLIQPLATAPSPLGEGHTYYDSANHLLKCYVGDKFVALQDRITGVSWTAGSTAGPKLKIMTDRSSTPLADIAIPSASGSASGVVTTGTQTFAGAKTFSGLTTFSGILFTAQGTARTNVHLEVVTIDGTQYLHTPLPFYSDQSVSAGGIGSGGTGGGSSVDVLTLTQLLAETSEDLTKVPSAYAIKALNGQFASSITSLQSAIDALSGAVTGITTTGSGNAVTSITKSGGALTITKGKTFLESHQTLYGLTIKVNGTSKGTYTPNSAAKTIDITASDLGLGNALHFLGETSTAVTDGGTQTPTIGGSAKTPSAGDVVLYAGKEFVWTSSGAWELFGDEGSYALKTVTVSGGKGSGHTYGLAGGGALSSNRTLTLDAATDTAIAHGVSAYNDLAGGFVSSVGGQSGAITLRSGSTTRGDVNLTLSGKQVQGTVVLADWAKAASKPTYTKSEVGLGNVENVSISSAIATQAATDKSTYAGVKSYAIASGKITFTPGSYEFADGNLVATLYDASGQVVMTDMKAVSSSGKYTMRVDFAQATTAAYTLVVIGKLA